MASSFRRAHTALEELGLTLEADEGRVGALDRCDEREEEGDEVVDVVRLSKRREEDVVRDARENAVRLAGRSVGDEGYERVDLPL